MRVSAKAHACALYELLRLRLMRSASRGVGPQDLQTITTLAVTKEPSLRIRAGDGAGEACTQHLHVPRLPNRTMRGPGGSSLATYLRGTAQPLSRGHGPRASPLRRCPRKKHREGRISTCVSRPDPPKPPTSRPGMFCPRQRQLDLAARMLFFTIPVDGTTIFLCDVL